MLIRYVETGAFSAVETHNRYTLLNRSAEPLLDVANRMGVAVINAAPYGSGILAKGPEAYARYAYSEASPILLERARMFAKVCQEYDVPLSRCSASIFASRPAYRQHGRWHEQTGTGSPDVGARELPDCP